MGLGGVKGLSKTNRGSQAVIGQKLLIELRQELYKHILQLPLQFFHQTQAGTIISAMTAELNAIGTFLGGAIAIPITSGPSVNVAIIAMTRRREPRA